MYAFLAALSLFICYGGNWLIGQCMIERPLVVGAVTGILLGDIPTGVAIGAALETIYMGAVNRRSRFGRAGIGNRIGRYVLCYVGVGI